MDVVWKDIPSYEGIYKASNRGEILNVKRGRIVKPCNGKDGYRILKLCKNGTPKTFYLHRIIAMTFISECRPNMQVNHINGNKLDNSAENLEYCTLQQNLLHSYKNGLKRLSPIAKINPFTMETVERYDSKTKCAKANHCGSKELTIACRNKSIYKGFLWKEITKEVSDNYFVESEE